MSAINSSTHYPKQEYKRPLTPGEFFYVNLVAKSSAVMCFHPLITVKNHFQAQAIERHPRQTLSMKKFNPFTIYRGVGVNLLNAPLFAFMGMANGTLKAYLSNGGQRELSQVELGTIALFSSFLGSFPWTTLDLLVIQTQWQNKDFKPHQINYAKLKDSLLKKDWVEFCLRVRAEKKSYKTQQTYKIKPSAIFWQIFEERGVRGLQRGLPATMWREMPFGFTLLYLAPQLHKQFTAKLPKDWEHRENVALIGSGIVAGTFTTLMTHGMDMIKTTIQRDWKAEKYPKILDAAIGIYQNGGFKTFLTGLMPRLGVIVIATTVVTKQSKDLTDKLSKI